MVLLAVRKQNLNPNPIERARRPGKSGWIQAAASCRMEKSEKSEKSEKLEKLGVAAATRRRSREVEPKLEF